MIETTLKKFGFNDKEILVYLTLLRLGSAPIRAISETLNINRTTVHSMLRTLGDYGLVSFVDKEKRRYFAAEPPEHLLGALKMKQNDLEQTRADIEKIIPELKSLYEKSEFKPKVKYFEGDPGIRTILQDVLDATADEPTKQYYVYSSSTIRNTLLRVFPEYNDERIKRGIRVQSISIGPGGILRGLDERKWLSREESSPTYTLIYAGRIALISLDASAQPHGVVMEDQNTYQTQVMIFRCLWEKL
ncbi:MAG: TrmB family transcriptional regulator [Parcubacteria group bacterium]|nr:TrmB family transcriptional regulator [Parcubacteria group bacterium]